MKKKIFYILILISIVITTTGCLKFNTTMNIKKDKSLEFSVIYAIDTAYAGEEELLSSQQKSELEKKGFQVQKYEEGSMRGFTAKRNIKNIDAISSNSADTYDLSSLVDTKEDNKYLFKVKKGLFKNKYKAKFKIDSSNNTLDNSGNSDSTIEYDTNTIDNSELPDLSNLANMNMDLSFNITLPYPAKMNNATNSKNNNKELNWNLTSNMSDNIEFEFELYNLTTIYITLGSITLIIILIILINKSKKNNHSIGNSNQVIQSTQTNKPSESNNQPLIQHPSSNQQPKNQINTSDQPSFIIPDAATQNKFQESTGPKAAPQNKSNGFIIPDPIITPLLPSSSTSNENSSSNNSLK